MSDDREGRIRERAYRLWQDEGEPHGKHDTHWQQAESEFAGEQPDATPEPQDGSDTPAVTSGDETTGAELTKPLANEPADSPATTIPSGSAPSSGDTNAASKAPRGRRPKTAGADTKATDASAAPKRPGPRTKRA